MKSEIDTTIKCSKQLVMIAEKLKEKHYSTLKTKIAPITNAGQKGKVVNSNYNFVSLSNAVSNLTRVRLLSLF